MFGSNVFIQIVFEIDRNIYWIYLDMKLTFYVKEFKFRKLKSKMIPQSKFFSLVFLGVIMWTK